MLPIIVNRSGFYTHDVIYNEQELNQVQKNFEYLNYRAPLLQKLIIGV